jgi:hypothetical protein
MIGIIHTLGGCGGTLLSRCLGVLPGVALLIEINPASVGLFPAFDPLYQDCAWLHLLDAAEAAEFSKKDLCDIENFRQLVSVFYQRATATARRLVLRDYSYVDFVGVPYTATPPRRLLLRTALPHAVPTSSIAFVRHPIDQWVSLCKHKQVRDVLAPSAFCDAYAAFLQEFGTQRVYKYETFVQNPHGELRAICDDLELPFDPSFIHRFHEFDCVTGDFTRLGETISAPQRKVLPPDLAAEFHSSASFRYVLAAAGYPESNPDADRLS